MSTQWVVLFDNEGLDTLVPYGDMVEEQVMSKLAGNEMSREAQHTISRIMLRARFNEQRHPEVWCYSTADDIEYQDMRDAWENNPQYMADLVRKSGEQLHGTKPGQQRAPVIV